MADRRRTPKAPDATAAPASIRAGIAVAAACGCCAAATAYSIARLLQAWLFPSPDPRTVLAVGPIAFYWNAQVAAYVGVLAAIVASMLRARAPARFDRTLPSMVAVVILVVVGQGIFVP
jgi:hypothetical protein